MRNIWHFLAGIGGTLAAWGPWGILLLGFIDSAGIPVSVGMDALVIALAVKAPERAWLGAGMAVVGSMLGNVVLFLAARKGGARFSDPAAPGEKHPQRFRSWFRRYGLATVFIPALVPIPLPLKVFVISAGVLGTPVRSFVLVVLAARVVRYGGEAWLGLALGEQSAGFLRAHGWHLTGVAALLFVGIYALLRLSDRSRRAI